MFGFFKKKTESPKGLLGIDLGLPSGLKWGSCNVGAEMAHEFGTYFAWGETVAKQSYSKENSSCSGMLPSDMNSKGILDADGNLSSKYDAASQICGKEWRLPTLADVKELIENCVWKWTSVQNVQGYLVRSKVNSNSIFLPAAGYCHDSSVDFAGDDGGYWSSTPGPDADRSNSLDFLSVNRSVFLSNRYNGRTIRPVCR